MPSDALKSIILRDAEVRAVQAGRATVRRAARIEADEVWHDERGPYVTREHVEHFQDGRYTTWKSHYLSCPLGAVGERRRVREAWRPWATTVVYRADQPDEFVNYYYPATHMKASESRLTVQIVAVRVEKGADGWEWVVEMERADA